MAEGAGVHWAEPFGEVPAITVTAVQPAMALPLSVNETVPVGVAPEPLVGATVAV
jgi:hypothetical protein